MRPSLSGSATFGPGQAGIPEPLLPELAPEPDEEEFVEVLEEFAPEASPPPTLEVLDAPPPEVPDDESEDREPVPQPAATTSTATTEPLSQLPRFIGFSRFRFRRRSRIQRGGGGLSSSDAPLMLTLPSALISMSPFASRLMLSFSSLILASFVSSSIF